MPKVMKRFIIESKVQNLFRLFVLKKVHKSIELNDKKHHLLRGNDTKISSLNLPSNQYRRSNIV